MIKASHSYIVLSGKVLILMLLCLLLPSVPAYAQALMRMDSLNRADTLEVLVGPSRPDTLYLPDSLVLLPDNPVQTMPPADSSEFKPDSNKALWYAALFPGLGQLYNRRYWKLPIVTGGIVGVAYAISWNGRYYNAYTSAYRDIIDNDPTTTYYEDILPAGYTYTTAQLTTVLKNRQQTFRRQRDLSIIAGVAWYLLCILDAYVDAELFDFNVSDDLSIQLKNPEPIQPLSPSFGGYGGAYNGLNVSCSFRF